MDSNQKLNKLEQLLKLLDEALTRDEFVKSFENVVNYVKKIENQNGVTSQALESSFKEMQAELRSNTSKDISSLKVEVQQTLLNNIAVFAKSFRQLAKEHDLKMAAIDEKIATVQDGKPADEIKIIKQVTENLQALIPDGQEAETGQTIVDKINALDIEDDEDKIDWTHIKNFPEVKKGKNSGTGGSGKYVAGQNMAINTNIVSLNIPIQLTAPSNPQVNDLWIDNS